MHLHSTRWAGTIEFDEVCTVIAPLYGRSTQALRVSFDFFDTDKSGFIDLNELEVLLCQLNMLGSAGSAEAARSERRWLRIRAPLLPCPSLIPSSKLSQFHAVKLWTR